MLKSVTKDGDCGVIKACNQLIWREKAPNYNHLARHAPHLLDVYLLYLQFTVKSFHGVKKRYKREKYFFLDSRVTVVFLVGIQVSFF